jgi:hypothetical protein
LKTVVFPEFDKPIIAIFIIPPCMCPVAAGNILLQQRFLL